MSWPGFYTPSSAWLFALAVPLVAFYFLKLKRPRQEVSSTVLWRQVMQDQRVNSPFQRFKRNILLLLQLILLGLVVLAAMQPYWRGRTERVRRLPVLIDCSASMGALDKGGGTTRLEAAKREVRQIIDGLPSDAELCLVSFDRSAQKLIGFTSNKRLLRQALESVVVRDVGGSTDDALRMAQALARGVSFDEVLLVSDGNFPERSDFELSFKLNYRKLGRGGANVGITSLEAVRTQDENWEVFARLESSSEVERGATVEVTRDGEEMLSQDVSVAGGASEKLVFKVDGQKACSLKVTVVPDGFDSLACDNVAYLELPLVRPLRVYVAPKMVAYQHALGSVKQVQVVSAGNAPYDLVITDQPEDRELPTTVGLYVGMVPEELARLVRVEDAGSEVVDWRRDVPLLQHVELGDLLLAQRPTFGPEAQETDLENLNYEVLVHGDRGPLLLMRRSERMTTYHMLFHSDRSTLPYRVGFPVLVSNLVRVASQQAGLEEVRGVRTGVLPGMAVAPGKTFSVRGPDGSTGRHTSDEPGILSGVSAAVVGEYEVQGEDGDVVKVGAGLLRDTETTLVSVDQLVFNEDLSVGAQAGPARTDKALWLTLAMVGFVVMLVEWWYFQRTPRWLVRVK